MKPAEGIRPVDAKERLALMDGLRGLALFGILLVNISAMAAPSMAYGGFALWSGPLSTGVSMLRHFLADGAFVFLFALLFGAGFSVMMGPFGGRGTGIGLPAYYRRLLLIGAFGLFHVLALWWGDILMVYAVAGAALPFFRNCGGRTLLAWAAALVAGPGLLLLGLTGLIALVPADPQAWAEAYRTETTAWIRDLVESYRSSDFRVVAEARRAEYLYNLWYLLIVLPMSLGYMLAGLWLARHDRFRLDERHDRFFQRCLTWALAPALLGKLLYVYGIHGPEATSMLATFCYVLGYMFGGPAMGVLFFCGLRQLYRTAAAGRIRRGLAAAGRIALTNYLLQSAFACLLFHGYGLGLYGKVPPAAQVLLVLAVFLVQAVASLAWLRHYRRGPLEELLRKFTYLGT